MTTAQSFTATAPTHTPDGSQGYFLKTDTGVGGWAYLDNDGRTVWATLDSRPWFVAGQVSNPSEFIPEWLEGHAAQILAIA
jgi:hypothetical protein